MSCGAAAAASIGLDWWYELWVYSYLVFKHEGLLVFSLFNLINLFFSQTFFIFLLAMVYTCRN